MIIRPAQESDELTIKALYKALLTETAPFGMDVAPTDSNVDRYWEYMFLPVIHGDAKGALLLAEENGAPMGALFWPQAASPFEMTEESALGLGVYVRPEARGKGVATQLRAEGLKLLHQLKIAFVLGFVHKSNTSGSMSAAKSKAEEVGTVLKFPTHA